MKKFNKQMGFTIVELVIVVAIIGILTTVAVPSYLGSVTRSSREGAQTELVQLAALQEKIYLNSNSYSSSVTATYTGQASGGLGLTAGLSKDKKYNYTCPAANCTANAFSLLATPVTGTGQANDGTLTIDSMGNRVWTKGTTVTPW